MVGKLSPGTDGADLDRVLQSIPLPETSTIRLTPPLDGQLDDVDRSNPELGGKQSQNSVTWIRLALAALRQRGWADDFEIQAFMDFALDLGDGGRTGTRWLARCPVQISPT